MNISAPRSPTTEVAYFRDAGGTWFAAELVRCASWTEALTAPPDPEEADIRIAFVDRLDEEPTGTALIPVIRPAWLWLLPASAEREPRLVADAALEAWATCDTFRARGPSAEEYVVAGYRALCPPHPPCAPRPGMRESLMGFLLGRADALGQLARGSDDAANRLFRIAWPTPERFADAVLRERIRDDGARVMLELVAFVEAAEVAEEAEAYVGLAAERHRLLSRLSPLAYFMQASDFDRAAALALDWQERYQRAYRTHYRAVLQAAHQIVAETAEACALLPELEAMNAHERPVGADPARRLRAALAELACLPEAADDRGSQTAGVVLGRMPHAIAEARLSAAAVLAAVEVHRRRQGRLGHLRSGQQRSVR